MSQTEAADPTALPNGDQQETNADGEGAKTAKTERARSKVVFPYDDLGAAITVASTIFSSTGDHATMEQLAGKFDQKTSSGAFRNKVTSARIFGLVTVSRQGVQLTELGRRILDERTAAQARVDAFLNVPLYEQLYERFKGGTLPPTSTALEAVIRDEGVAPKQVTTARWRFQRSAELAGFFDHGDDRLVMPAIAAAPQPDEKPVDAGDPGSGSTERGETKVIDFGDSGTVTINVNVKWLSLPADTMVKLREAVDAFEKLRATAPSTGADDDVGSTRAGEAPPDAGGT